MLGSTGFGGGHRQLPTEWPRDRRGNIERPDNLDKSLLADLDIQSIGAMVGIQISRPAMSCVRPRDSMKGRAYMLAGARWCLSGQAAPDP